jgi:hypothetical protein
MGGAVHTATSKKRIVGGIHNRIDRKQRDICLDGLQWHKHLPLTVSN